MSDIPVLSGGKKLDAFQFVATAGTPDFSDPQGVHGTMQMALTDDPQVITAAIKSKFARVASSARMDLNGDIHYVAHDNGDGTMEVNFEVQ